MQSIKVNDGEIQRSNIKQISVKFSGNANIAALISSGDIVNAIKVFNKTTSTQVPLSASRYQYDALTRTVRIDLTVDGLGGSESTMLADGRYQLRLDVA
ncbi:MAG: hypothetical protein HC813_03370, partial [Planctomycetes bacterium]|nr:hypothetical protein [Planctomycetota bacterium]